MKIITFLIIVAVVCMLSFKFASKEPFVASNAYNVTYAKNPCDNTRDTIINIDPRLVGADPYVGETKYVCLSKGKTIDIRTLGIDLGSPDKINIKPYCVLTAGPNRVLGMDSDGQVLLKAQKDEHVPCNGAVLFKAF
jgi:hypothetical protein